MAVMLHLLVNRATRDQFNDLDARVGQAMSQGGGPPAGLMAHVVFPEGDGFVVAEVWSTQAQGETYVDDVLRPLLAELHLTGSETTVLPVWSFARP